MAFEQFRVQIAMLLDEIAKNPSDAHEMQESLREKLTEMQAMGLPLPEDSGGAGGVSGGRSRPGGAATPGALGQRRGRLRDRPSPEEAACLSHARPMHNVCTGHVSGARPGGAPRRPLRARRAGPRARWRAP